MLINEIQLQMLFQIAVDSIVISDDMSSCDIPVFKYKKQTRNELVNEILNQQSRKLKEINE